METLAYLHLVESYDDSQSPRNPSSVRLSPLDRPPSHPITAVQNDRSPCAATDPETTEVIEPPVLHPVFWMMP